MLKFTLPVVCIFALINLDLAIYSVLQDLGCWKDDIQNPVVPSIENFILPPHLTTGEQVKECASKAKLLGFRFVVMRKNFCGSSSDADVKYSKYGPAFDCHINGTGASESIQVYELDAVIDVQYRKIGCFRESDYNRMPTIEKQFLALHDPGHSREDPLAKCARSAEALGHRIFAIRASGYCASSANGRSIYMSYNETCGDNSGFTGSTFLYNKTEVYELTEGKKIGIEFRGCFEFKPRQMAAEILLLETQSDVLPKPFTTRDHALERCARYACGFDRTAIGINIRGHPLCTASSSGPSAYIRYSPLPNCTLSQGMYARRVYSLHVRHIDYHSDGFEMQISDHHITNLGCWKDETNLLPEIETAIYLRNDDIGLTKGHFIQRCAFSAQKLGVDVFGVWNNRCYASTDSTIYHKLTPHNHCDEHHDENSTESVELFTANTIFTKPMIVGLGCWADRPESVLTSMEGTISMLDGHPAMREDAVSKCGMVAAMRGFKVFAVQNGHCFGSIDAHLMYKKYGRGICSTNGRGHDYVNQVYEIKTSSKIKFRNLGCWTTDSFQTLPIAEGLSPELSDDHSRRTNALEKCAHFAHSVGNRFFALQDGGICSTASTENEEYHRIGNSDRCLRDGNGGKWSNQVYEIV